MAVTFFSSSVGGQSWSEIESNLSANRTELQNSTYINGVCNEDVGICVCAGNCPQFVVDNWSQYGSGCKCAQLDDNTDCSDMNKCDCIYDCHCTSDNATGITVSVQGGGSNYYFIGDMKFYSPLVACPDGGALPLPEYVKPSENSSDTDANSSEEAISSEEEVGSSGTILSFGRYITFTAIISPSLLNSVIFI